MRKNTMITLQNAILKKGVETLLLKFAKDAMMTTNTSNRPNHMSHLTFV